MKCEIVRQNQDIAPQKIANASLLQDSRYCAALASTSALKPFAARILIDGQEAGYARFMEIRTLWGTIHGITLDRGPVWHPGYGGAHHHKAFFDALTRLYPSRPGRRRRLIPEIEDGPAARKMLESAGLRRAGEGYQTFLLDLTRPIDDLRAGLHQKWRNVLNRAERDAELAVQWDDAARQMPWFLKVYEQDKRRKDYDGPSPHFLNRLASLMSSSGDMLIGRVMKGGAAIAAVLIVRHGAQATYLAGWSGEAGRAAGAHHLLLWQGCAILKDKGVTVFDLGGFNDAHEGIRQFKQGMGGRPYRLAGRYA